MHTGELCLTLTAKNVQPTAATASSSVAVPAASTIPETVVALLMQVTGKQG